MRVNFFLQTLCERFLETLDGQQKNNPFPSTVIVEMIVEKRHRGPAWYPVPCLLPVCSQSPHGDSHSVRFSVTIWKPCVPQAKSNGS